MCRSCCTVLCCGRPEYIQWLWSWWPIINWTKNISADRPNSRIVVVNYLLIPTTTTTQYQNKARGDWLSVLLEPDSMYMCCCGFMSCTLCALEARRLNFHNNIATINRRFIVVNCHGLVDQAIEDIYLYRETYIVNQYVGKIIRHVLCETKLGHHHHQHHR